MSNQETKRIMSVSDVLRKVMDVEQMCFDAGMGESLFWYRGHADEAWELQPGVLRNDHAQRVRQSEALMKPDNMWDSVLHNERTINRRFRDEAYLHLGDVPESHMYFVAQHYGLPTRLLDWSLNPLVALFFACHKEIQTKDGCIYLLCPRNLPNILGQCRQDPPSPFTDVASGYHPVVRRFIQNSLFDFETVRDLQHTPIIPITPVATTSRIPIQSSRFTFHPPMFKQDSSSIKSPYILAEANYTLEKFIIDKDGKGKILAELNRLGIHHYSLFQDLDNLALHLKTIYCNRSMYMPLENLTTEASQ